MGLHDFLLLLSSIKGTSYLHIMHSYILYTTKVIFSRKNFFRQQFPSNFWRDVFLVSDCARMYVCTWRTGFGLLKTILTFNIWITCISKLLVHHAEDGLSANLSIFHEIFFWSTFAPCTSGKEQADEIVHA